MTDDADRLRDALRAAGMTQRALARAMGYRDEQVSRWVHGKAPVPAVAWTVIRLTEQLTQVRAAVGAPDERKRRRRVTA